MFKVIPSLPAWSRMLALTHPENWSPHACRAATRIFISTMKPPQAQLFLEVVLLDAIRSDITQNQKLNPHYYECLKRSLFKPSAFFKGLIFPLLDVRSPIHGKNQSNSQTIIDWLHIERSCDRCFCACEEKSTRAAFFGSSYAHRGNGLHR